MTTSPPELENSTPPPEPATRNSEHLLFAGITPTFRGEIWENAAGVPMGKGYTNENKPFDITTAFYLRPVFQAIKNHNVRKAVLRAAVQTLKTFVVEESTAYFIQHEPGEMAVYDCDIDAAKDHAKTRFMPRLRAIEGISTLIAEIENRWDLTTTEILLPAMNLRLWPLNESAVQRITLQYVFICDAFLAQKNGLLLQAIARATQHPNDRKIIIESQGSEAGDDFDRQFDDTDQRELHVRCPYCAAGQPFEWTRTRTKNFAAILPREQVLEILTRHGCETELETVMAWQHARAV